MDGRGEAYVWVEKGFIFFEYWFPSTLWTGFGVSNQIVELGDSNCYECFEGNGEVYNEACLEHCLTNQVFVITGLGDPFGAWEHLEVKLNNLGDSSLRRFQLDSFTKLFYDPTGDETIPTHGVKYK